MLHEVAIAWSCIHAVTSLPRNKYVSATCHAGRTCQFCRQDYIQLIVLPTVTGRDDDILSSNQPAHYDHNNKPQVERYFTFC
ncbi:hypothetical protein BDR06DRAFT_960373, partial [Suillus hirtellus]